jgi:hypothetical protein
MYFLSLFLCTVRSGMKTFLARIRPFLCKTALARESGPYVWMIEDKTEGRKSCATFPLTGTGKTALARESGPYVWIIEDKTEGRKSCATFPLTGTGKTALARESGPYVWMIEDKTEGRKSCATFPLTGTGVVRAYRYITFLAHQQFLEAPIPRSNSSSNDHTSNSPGFSLSAAPILNYIISVVDPKLFFRIRIPYYFFGSGSHLPLSFGSGSGSYLTSKKFRIQFRIRPSTFPLSQCQRF